MKKAAKEAFDNNMNHHDTKETIAKVYLRNRKCFVQQVVYHIFFPELKRRRIFPAVYFVNTNLQEERVQVLFLKKNLPALPGDSPNILNRSVIDRYMERGSATTCKEKDSVLNDFVTQNFWHITHL